MNLDQTEATEGFWGRIAHYANPTDAWALALPAVISATGRPESEVIAFLESHRGYFFANDIAIGLERGEPLGQVIRSTAAKLPQQINNDWAGSLVQSDRGNGRRRGGETTAVLRYADHPVFGRLFWFYSSMHISFAGGGGESSDHFSLDQNGGTGFSAYSNGSDVLYGAGQHLSFLDHMTRLGRRGLSFGSDAEQDAILAWMITADWRDLPQPSSSAFRSSTWVRVLITGGTEREFTVHVPGFPSCTGIGATEHEALQAAEDALTAHLIAIIVAGTQMPSLFAKETPDLPGAREAHLTIKSPRPRRNALAAAQPRVTEIPGIDDLLSRQEQQKLDTDLMLTGTPLSDALHDRGCDAYTGNHTTQANPTEAAKWFALAAEQGHTQARLVLGCLYRDGHGIPRDIAKAINCWEQTDHPLACYLLGLAYSDRQGIAPDVAMAGQWLRKAAAAGLPDATGRLLALLDDGQLTPIDADEPLHWLQQAAARGNRAAHNRVLPVTKGIMNKLFKLAMAAPALPSPMSEWRIVRLDDARPPEMPAKCFAGYLDVLYSTRYLQPDNTPGFAQVWIYELRDKPTLNLAEIGRRKPLN